MGVNSLPFGLWRRRRSATADALASNLTIADMGRAATTQLLVPLNRTREATAGPPQRTER